MKKQIQYIVIFLIIGSLLYVLNYFKDANSASIRLESSLTQISILQISGLWKPGI